MKFFICLFIVMSNFASADVASVADLKDTPKYNCVLIEYEKSESRGLDGDPVHRRKSYLKKVITAPNANTAVTWLKLLADLDLLAIKATDIVCSQAE